VTPRTRLTPEERREQILAAAERLAAHTDLERVPTAAVAAEAGVSEGLLFHYFPTRRALQLAVVERSGDELIEAERGVPDGPPPERLLAALGTYVDHVEAHPQSWRVLLRGSDDPEVAAVLRRVDDVSIELLLTGIQTDAEHAPAPLLLAVRGWLAFEKEACAAWLADPSAVSREVLISSLAGALLGALQGVAGSDGDCAALLAPVLPSTAPVLPPVAPVPPAG
jgi:AcrR family transcriptional regulator